MDDLRRKQKRRFDTLGSVLTVGGWTVMSVGVGILLPGLGIALFGVGAVVLGLALCGAAERMG